MRYAAPSWLPGGHLQTIFPAKLVRKPRLDFRRERWAAPDGDFIDVDFVDGPGDAPRVVLFHGLEGSSQSGYALALMAEVRARGWRCSPPGGLPSMVNVSNTLCTASIIPLIATCCSMRTRACGPAANILAQLSRTWSCPLRRAPAGCTQTISSSSAHTAIIPSRSQRSSAS